MRNSCFNRLLSIDIIMQVMRKRRVTVSINSDLEMKIRSLQAEIIGQTSRSTSFSSVLNEVLSEAFKAQVDTRVHKRFSPGQAGLWI